MQVSRPTSYVLADGEDSSISGLVVEYIVAIDVTQVRFPADADARSESGSSHAVIRSQGLPLALRFPPGACLPSRVIGSTQKNAHSVLPKEGPGEGPNLVGGPFRGFEPDF